MVIHPFMEAIWCSPECLYWLVTPEVEVTETIDVEHKNINPNPLKNLQNKQPQFFPFEDYCSYIPGWYSPGVPWGKTSRI